MHLNPMFKRGGSGHEYENTGDNVLEANTLEDYEPYLAQQRQKRDAPQLDMEGYVVDDRAPTNPVGLVLEGYVVDSSAEQYYTGLTTDT